MQNFQDEEHVTRVACRRQREHVVLRSYRQCFESRKGQFASLVGTTSVQRWKKASQRQKGSLQSQLQFRERIQ